MGCIEFPKELKVSVFSFKAKSGVIIGKKVGTMSSTEFVLVGLNALGGHDGLGRGDQLGLFVRKKPF